MIPELAPSAIVGAYHQLYDVEQSLRISKSKLEICPIFHFNEDRIKAHISICFVALKVYRELDRMLKNNRIVFQPSSGEFAIRQHRISAFVMRTTCAVTNDSLSLPRKPACYGKTLYIFRRLQIPIFGTSELEIRWDGEFGILD